LRGGKKTATRGASEGSIDPSARASDPSSRAIAFRKCECDAVSDPGRFVAALVRNADARRSGSRRVLAAVVAASLSRGALSIASPQSRSRRQSAVATVRSNYLIRNRENGMNEMHGNAGRVVKQGCRTMKTGTQEISGLFVVPYFLPS